MAVALAAGSEVCGGAKFHIDTGISGISIEDPRLAVALASAVGGRWDDHGDLNLNAAASTNNESPIIVIIGAIRAVITSSVWKVGTTGRTIFSRYHKNVVGLPFIMAGDMVFDDAHRRIYFGDGGGNRTFGAMAYGLGLPC